MEKGESNVPLYWSKGEAIGEAIDEALKNDIEQANSCLYDPTHEHPASHPGASSRNFHSDGPTSSPSQRQVPSIATQKLKAKMLAMKQLGLIEPTSSLEHMICKGKEACESFKPKLQFLGQCTEKQRGQLNERLPGGSGLEFERPNKDALWQVYIVRDLEGLHECLCGQLKYLFEDELTAIFGRQFVKDEISKRGSQRILLTRSDGSQRQKEADASWVLNSISSNVAPALRAGSFVEEVAVGNEEISDIVKNISDWFCSQIVQALLYVKVFEREINNVAALPEGEVFLAYRGPLAQVVVEGPYKFGAHSNINGPGQVGGRVAFESDIFVRNTPFQQQYGGQTGTLDLYDIRTTLLKELGMQNQNVPLARSRGVCSQRTMTRHLQLQGMVAGPLAGFQAPLRIF